TVTPVAVLAHGLERNPFQFSAQLANQYPGGRAPTRGNVLNTDGTQPAQPRARPRRIDLTDHSLSFTQVGGSQPRRVERQRTAEQLVHHYAKTVDVRSRVDVRRPSLLGRHVFRRAQKLVRLGERYSLVRARSDRPGDAEVDDLHERLCPFAMGD